MIMKLEFKARDAKRKLQHEIGKYTIWYRTEGKGRWKMSPNLLVSPENVDKTILMLQTNSSLWYNGRNYRNGVLNEEIEPLY